MLNPAVNHSKQPFKYTERMELGDRIKEAREAAGLTISELARRVGVGKSAAHQWESGTSKNLRMEHLFAVERETGYSARWIATGEGPKAASEIMELDDESRAIMEYLVRLSDEDRALAGSMIFRLIGREKPE